MSVLVDVDTLLIVAGDRIEDLVSLEIPVGMFDGLPYSVAMNDGVSCYHVAGSEEDRIGLFNLVIGSMIHDHRMDTKVVSWENEWEYLKVDGSTMTSFNNDLDLQAKMLRTEVAVRRELFKKGNISNFANYCEHNDSVPFERMLVVSTAREPHNKGLLEYIADVGGMVGIYLIHACPTLKVPEDARGIIDISTDDVSLHVEEWHRGFGKLGLSTEVLKESLNYL